MATEKQSPFDELNEEEQKAAVEIGVLTSVLGVRLPTAGKALYDYICEEFLKSYALTNSGKYALRHVGKELWESDWEFTVTKRGMRLVTKFNRLQSGNGETTAAQ